MIYAIVGPTASGKSELAEYLSNKLNKAPIINFDAFQIYIELNKGTAKPDDNLLKNSNYYLYNYVSICDDFDVSKYQNDGRKLLSKFLNKDVILVGGTGLYLKALLYDYKFLKEEKMPNDFLNNYSNDELYQKLYEIDQIDALKIGKGNRKRLLRALYIYSVHKENKTNLNKNGKDKLLFTDVMFLGLDIEREELYKKINLRVDKMFKNGLKEEVNYLKGHFDNNLKAFKAIGYKEFFLGLDEENTKELIKKNTRNYAKRQMTFFKHQFNNIIRFKSLSDGIKYIDNIIK